MEIMVSLIVILWLRRYKVGFVVVPVLYIFMIVFNGAA